MNRCGLDLLNVGCELQHTWRRDLETCAPNWPCCAQVRRAHSRTRNEVSLGDPLYRRRRPQRRVVMRTAIRWGWIARASRVPAQG